MAFWDKLGSSGNVEDRRGAGLAIGGGTAVLGIVAYLIFGALGVQVDPGLLQQILGGANTGDTSQYAGTDDYERFASSVVGSTDEYWKREFAAQSKEFTPSKLVLFRTATQSGCGIATSDVGPHYCPPDQTIYLDETFFDVLKNQLGGSNDDVAQAYVIAHEAGHHAQHLLGIMDQVQADPNYSATGENSLAVRVELQADCFAGLWAHSIRDRGVFEPGEINEAITAAGAVGDDRIQQSTQGQTNPETWTHGSAQQRIDAFNRGYNSGKFASCQL